LGPTQPALPQRVKQSGREADPSPENMKITPHRTSYNTGTYLPCPYRCSRPRGHLAVFQDKEGEITEWRHDVFLIRPEASDNKQHCSSGAGYVGTWGWVLLRAARRRDGTTQPVSCYTQCEQTCGYTWGIRLLVTSNWGDMGTWWRLTGDMGTWWRLTGDIGTWWRLTGDMGTWWRLTGDMVPWWRLTGDMGTWWRLTGDMGTNRLHPSSTLN
jgi:hypothetical protein